MAATKRKFAGPVTPFKKKYKKTVAKPKISLSQLPKCVKPESKKIVRTKEGFNLSSLTENTLAIAPFAYIQSGTLVDQRIGNNICLQSLNIKGHLENRSSTQNTMLCRMAIVRNKQHPEILFSGNEALIKANAPVSLGALGAESSYLDWNKAKYDVLGDQVIKLGAANNNNGSDIMLFRMFKKLYGEAEYNYSIGQPPNGIVTGNWQFVMWACDPDNAGQSTTSINGYVQVTGYYTDP